MRVAFCVQELRRGGGQIMIMKQANHLAASGRHEVFLVSNTEDFEISSDLHPRVSVVSRHDAPELPRMDITVLTWWATGLWCTEVPSRAYGQYLQSFEDRFHERSDRLSRDWATEIQLLGWPTVTEASWIMDSLSVLAPDQPRYLVPNGIDKAVFPVVEPRPRVPDEPLRVVVEGSSAWFKHTREALDAVANAPVPVDLTYVSASDDWVDGSLSIDRLTSYRRVSAIDQREFGTLLRRSDVMVKLSSVEGMAGPPLEAMHSGCTVIVSPVTGIDEYVVHGWNGVIVPMSDTVSVHWWLERLYKDPELLRRLQVRAQATAAEWPEDAESSAMFEQVLQAAAELEWHPAHIPSHPDDQWLIGFGHDLRPAKFDDLDTRAVLPCLADETWEM